MMNAGRTSPLAPYVVPFALFLGGLGLVSLVKSAAGPQAPLLLRSPEYWIYPLQTLVSGGALVFYWRKYEFGPAARWWAGILVGLLALILWISPQVWFGAAARREGFDPSVFTGDAVLYWSTVAARFARLVVVVPLLEEIFWRGFLMRYLIREDFLSVPFGTYQAKAFFGVAGLFMLVHAPSDWPAAFLTGLLYNFLAVRTGSLGACVVAHAVTNLGLGVFIMVTRQWGFW